MLVKTEGLILKITKFRETSLIVKAYTQSHGLLSFIVKGVRSSKNTSKAVLFQGLNFLDLIIYYKENKSLLNLKEYKFNFLYKNIPFDIIKSSIAILILEVIEHTLNEEEENEELYDFIKQTFINLDLAEKNIANIHLQFLIDFMYYVGIHAQGKYTLETPFFNMKEGAFAKTPASFAYIKGKLAENFSSLLHHEELFLNKTERKKLLETLLLYYQIHIDNFRKIKSLEVFETIMN